MRQRNHTAYRHHARISTNLYYTRLSRSLMKITALQILDILQKLAQRTAEGTLSVHKNTAYGELQFNITEPQSDVIKQYIILNYDCGPQNYSITILDTAFQPIATTVIHKNSGLCPFASDLYHWLYYTNTQDTPLPSHHLNF
jgi:hypothetical protein